MIAFAKLQELIRGRPITYPGQKVGNWDLLAALRRDRDRDRRGRRGPVAAVGDRDRRGSLFGVLFVLPIGGADMPVVISLLNAFTGLAAAATGFVLENNVLIVAGMLVGASGTLLTLMMGRAMNRSIANVLFGAFGQVAGAAAAAAADGDGPVRSTTAEDVAVMLAYARQGRDRRPGYGMAVAQAQHDVRELADLLEATRRRGDLRDPPCRRAYAGAHERAARRSERPLHRRSRRWTRSNAEFPRTDVALVIGANDVVNPAARNNPASPIYGMPILDVDSSNATIVLKRSMNPGFAGIENPLFVDPKTLMLFGDAKESVAKLTAAVKAL